MPGFLAEPSLPASSTTDSAADCLMHNPCTFSRLTTDCLLASKIAPRQSCNPLCPPHNSPSFGGLRCPSEVLALTWGDVDWGRSRLRVPSAKTEHIEGREFRWIPLFPELRCELGALWDQLLDGTPGTAQIITRYRSVQQNLRRTLEKIIRRAGLRPWPKLFQNLRSTRETELAESFPIHVVCDWIGNTQAVSTKHYLQVTDDHFERAAALQNPVQQEAVMGSTVQEAMRPTPENPGGYGAVQSNTTEQAPRLGLEPRT